MTDDVDTKKARPALRGRCSLCGRQASKTAMARHVASCAAGGAAAGGQHLLLHLRVDSPDLPIFWMDVEVDADAKLTALDRFLRDSWLECCGHLSAFRVGPVTYSSSLGDRSLLRPGERGMHARIGEVFTSAGQLARYEYDFGSTTELRLRVVGARRGAAARPAVRLLARNEAPVWPCAACGSPATLVCPYCFDTGAFACDEHADAHPCDEPDCMLPVVDSPRMGVCGYTGPL